MVRLPDSNSKASVRYESKPQSKRSLIKLQNCQIFPTLNELRRALLPLLCK